MKSRSWIDCKTHCVKSKLCKYHETEESNLCQIIDVKRFTLPVVYCLVVGHKDTMHANCVDLLRP